MANRDPFAALKQSSGENNDPLSTIRIAQPRERERVWEKKNRAYPYYIPARLSDTAIAVRDAVLWIARHDEQGRLREDRTTVDSVAAALIDYALTMAEKENISFAPTRQGRMTMEWREAESGWDAPIEIGKVARGKKKNRAKVKGVTLSYRWTAEHHARIEALAGKVEGADKHNPRRYQVPIGEVVVRLLQRGIADYKARKMRLVTRPISTAQTVSGWASA